MNPQNEILKIVADNPNLLEALKKEFEKVYNVDDWDLRVDNETLGQNVRAFEMAKEAVKLVFREIEKYKTMPNQPEKLNPAR